jgi:N-acetylneuraminate lyase
MSNITLNWGKTLGLVAAPPTAFLDNNAIDFAAIPPLATHLHRQGVTGVFVNGTTGEGMSLTTDERERTVEAWRAALPAGMKLFVHAGHNSQGDAVRLAAHAQRNGADAVAVIAPSFFKPVGVAGMVEWCAPIAAAAPELPFYFYHMPAMSGVHLSVARFLEAAGPRIPNLAGIKFTFEALADFQEALELEDGRYDVLWGRDEMLLGALATGARGGVGSTYNVAAPLYLELMAAFERGDLRLARRLQAAAIAMINAMVGTGNFFVALKAMLRAQGVPISTRVRAPLENVPEDRLAVPAVPDPLAVRNA